MINEYKIRDFFKANLNLIENGLEFIKDEFSLPNDFGTSGRIDILARDKFNHLVVIEIKRSDIAARNAIHELLKYTALLQYTNGIPAHQIRCIILSTEWGELLAPFSEFKSQTQYQVDGFKIAFNDGDEPFIESDIKTIDINNSLELCPQHAVWLYDNKESRNNALKSIIQSSIQIPYVDFAVIEMDYHGKNNRVIFPYALYISVFSIQEKYYSLLENQEIIHIEDEDFEEDAYDEDWYLDDDNEEDDGYDEEYDNEDERSWEKEINVQAWLFEQCKIAELGDFESGSPEKFFSIIKDWQVVRVNRFGNILKENKIISDKDILRMFSGIEGDNSRIFSTIASPKHNLSWQQKKLGIRSCLRGNSYWQSIINRYLYEIETNYPNSAVSFMIFTPFNFLIALDAFSMSGDIRYLPHFEIFIDNQDGKYFNTIIGFLTWDCETIPPPPEQFINDELIFEILLTGQCSNKKSLLDYHGFKYRVVELMSNKNAVDSQELILIKDELERIPFEHSEVNTLEIFLANNEVYIKNLNSLLRKYVHGLDND